MQTKITHLTSAHPRYDTRIFIKMCSSLAKNENYQVSLVVADGKGDEVKNGVDINDVGAKTGGRISRMTITVKKVFKKAKELDSHIYHLHDPELIPVGLKLKKLGKKVIFDIHENTDLQIMEKEWLPFISRKSISYIFRKYEDYACKRFDLLIMPQEAMYLKYKKLAKTIVIGNFPNKIEKFDLSLKTSSKFDLLYSGGISKARGLFNMLKLIEELNKLDNRYKLTLAGKIDDRYLEQAKECTGWKYTDYLGLLSKDAIYKVYTKNSIGLILFNNVGQYFMAYALKLFEYMQNGMYVVMPDFGDWTTFNQSYGAGLNVDTTNAKKIALQIHELNNEKILQVGKSNIYKVDEYFSWESQEIKLFNIYKELLNAK